MASILPDNLKIGRQQAIAPGTSGRAEKNNSLLIAGQQHQFEAVLGDHVLLIRAFLCIFVVQFGLNIFLVTLDSMISPETLVNLTPWVSLMAESLKPIEQLTGSTAFISGQHFPSPTQLISGFI